MKAKLGVFSNANALLVAFELSHKDLILAQSIDANSLQIKDNEKNILFRVFNTSNTVADPKGVSFPFLHENEQKIVEIIFIIPGGDTQTIRYNAAKIIQNLKLVETQIKVVLTEIEKTANTIEILGFNEETVKKEK